MKKQKIQKNTNRFTLILKERRNTSGKKMTLKDVQRGTGVSYPVLFDLKHQKRDNFDVRTLKSISDFLQVTTEELLHTFKPKKETIYG